MRKENRTTNESLNLNRTLQSYHQGGYGADNHEQYAFMGYSKNLFFVSDRAKELDENFVPLDSNVILKGYGLEIETNFVYGDHAMCANIVKYALSPIFPKHLFKTQADCTITGCEIITQVMSKEFIRNNYRNFKQMWEEIFPAFGITTQNDDCGMHVNVSLALLGTTPESQEENVRKLYYFINKNYNLCKVLFNRVNSTEYCRQMPYENAKTMDVHNMPSSHGNCFNGSHFDAGRIEIRLVGGQKNFACFRNTLETIFHLVNAIKGLKWKDLDDMTKVFAGCNNYVFDRLTRARNEGRLTSADIEKIESTVKAVEYI